MPQFGNVSLLPLQASVPSVSFPVNNMHSSANVLPPPSAVPLQTMISIITNGSFAIGQPESLPVPMLPAHPGSGFVSLSPAFAGDGFSSSRVNPPPVFISAPNCHVAPVQTQHIIPFVLHTMSPNINDFYTSDANLWRLAATTPIVRPAQFCNAGTPPPRILVVGLCILILRQFIPNRFRILSIILILVISQPTKTTYRLPLIQRLFIGSTSLSGRELAELLMHSRKDNLPDGS